MGLSRSRLHPEDNSSKPRGVFDKKNCEDFVGVLIRKESVKMKIFVGFNKRRTGENEDIEIFDDDLAPCSSRG